MAAKALAPAPNTFSFPPTAPLLLPESLPQLCVKPVVAQSALELVELPLLLSLLDEESPPTVLPTPPDPPGTLAAVEDELLAEAVPA